MNLLTVAEVAEKLRLSERFVYDEIRRKNLRAAKVGNALRVTEEDYAAYVEAHMNVSKVRRSA
jgi:excisionase family DNA binding protein